MSGIKNVFKRFSQSSSSVDEKNRTESIPLPNGTQTPVSVTSIPATGSSTPPSSFHSPGDGNLKQAHKQKKAASLTALTQKLHIGRKPAEEHLNNDGEPMSKNQLRKKAKEDEKREKRQAKLEARADLEEKRQEEAEEARKLETPEQQARYGTLPVNQSQEWPHEKRWQIGELSEKDIGQQVVFRARIHTHRVKGSKLVFFVFRQQIFTLQGVLELDKAGGTVTPYMCRWAGRILPGSIVIVKGDIQKPPEEVKGASIHDAELKVRELHIISEVTDHPPFDVYDVEKALAATRDEHHAKPNDEDHSDDDDDTSEEHSVLGSNLTPTIGDDGILHKVSMRTRLDNRIIDLRSTTSQGIFRINSGICNLFRTHLDSLNFIEVHTPKLQGGATESGASVFSVNYFGRDAFLAQSPQLAKQMCIASDFERVYEIGPVFRAENSNTHRHLTEYTGVDLEMAFEEHYHEVLHVIDDTLKFVFKGLYERYRREIDVVKLQYPHEDLVWLPETPIIPFADGIKLLHSSGWTDASEDEDLSTRSEIRLGELVKEKYGADYYILDKFPVSARPFYTMPDPVNPKVTNSFDIFVRGQEILSGGQRIHSYEMLRKRMLEMGVSPDSEAMEDYMDGFKWGAPPHGGGGIGLERIIMLILGLGDVRLASLFHRDPKSLQVRPVEERLRHPEASTLHPPWEKTKEAATEDSELQPLEKLIANYGDATNTAWLDERYRVWRDYQSGAAVGWCPSRDYAIILGDPLCDKGQYGKAIQAFLRYIKKETKLKPVWLLVGECGENILGGKLGWRTLTCVAESRVDPSQDPAENDNNVARKIRHAEKEGVKITDLTPGEAPPQEIRQECEQRMEDWKAGRKGRQAHLTELNPFTDPEHRMYFVARDKEGKVCSMVAMAQLSLENGWQCKYALDFPGSPSGSIEMIIAHALKVVNESGATSVTFGGSASDSLEEGHNLGGVKGKILAKTYAAISSTLKLTNKSDFREKLGAKEDPVYICYPKGGMGPAAVKAIMEFFGAGEE